MGFRDELLEDDCAASTEQGSAGQRLPQSAIGSLRMLVITARIIPQEPTLADQMSTDIYGERAIWKPIFDNYIE